MGSRPSLEGFGEAEGSRHPEDTGGSNAGTKWFKVRVGGAGLYSQFLKIHSRVYTSKHRKPQSTVGAGGIQLIISCQQKLVV